MWREFVLIQNPKTCHAQAHRSQTMLQAAVVDRTETAATPYVQPSGKGMGFYTGEDGYLYVDNLRIDDIRAEVHMPKP